MEARIDLFCSGDLGFVFPDKHGWVTELVDMRYCGEVWTPNSEFPFTREKAKYTWVFKGPVETKSMFRLHLENILNEWNKGGVYCETLFG